LAIEYAQVVFETVQDIAGIYYLRISWTNNLLLFCKIGRAS